MIDSLQSLAIAAVIGLLSGTDTAIWGMYKDAAHEGFSTRRFARSMIVGAGAAVILQGALGLALPSAATLVMLFGLAYAAERGIVEVWKTFVREEDQSKYSIPMQFSIRGVPVASRAARLAAGTLYVAALALCLTAVARLDSNDGAPLVITRVAVLGVIVGLIIAVGGAWKDAPTEGFEPLKFFRSPCLTVFFALLLSSLTDSYLQVTVAAIGYERAAAETYKTFCFPSKPRGKFAGKPVLHPEMLLRRRRFVPVYVAIRAVLLVSALSAFRDAARCEAPAPLKAVGGHP